MVGKGPITTVQFYDASDSCPFAAKAWLTLLEKGIKFERHTIDLKNKPKYFSDLYASINPDPAALAKVPLLIGSARIQDAFSILRKAEWRFLRDTKGIPVLTCRTPNFHAQAAAADGDQHIIESNLVAEYLDHTFPDLGPKLFPTEPLKLFKVRSVKLASEFCTLEDGTT